MAKFIISTDSCADYFKSEMQQNSIHCIPVKRIHGDKVYEELVEDQSELDAFYDAVKKGKLSSTSQINPEEFLEYFGEVLNKEKEGDIIHISLSSGLSGTFNGAVLAANELNEGLKGRKIYVVDSLIATVGMMMMIERLLELQREGVAPEKAIKEIEIIRNNQQAFIMVDDLGHLKRGGRLSATKALIGSILGVKPILTINTAGKIVPIAKAKGTKNAITAITDLVEKNKVGEVKRAYIVKTSHSDTYTTFAETLKSKYPSVKFTERVIGPVIGTHVGCGAIAVLFQGKPRVDISG